jgi:sterol desaturase/sphingolipid hydroxylase (fatty acid hydroxylase superfamily)
MTNEAIIRLSIFLGIFVAVGAAEIFAPRRPKLANWKERWLANLSILVLDVLIQRATIGAVAVVAAIWAEANDFGLFRMLDLPWFVAGIIGFLLLDFAIYGQHVVTHKVPILWRVHRVHHADEDVDLTTGLRFHPIEILLSALFKGVIVLALGIEPWVVLLFEAVLNASAVYTHGNLALPEKLDRVLRWIFCTPDMHRVHHSVIREETDSNYGFFLSIWDRAFGTYRKDPVKGQLGVELGLSDIRGHATRRLFRMLVMPFKNRNF